MKRVWAYGLNESLPVYVTRKYGEHGTAAHYDCSIWMTLLAGFLIWLNIVVWGILGLYFAVKVVL
jgi:hypothetical protein